MAIISVPPDQASNAKIFASLWNTLKNTIYTEFNGFIDNANIKAAAGILSSKVADNAMVLGNATSPGTQTATRPTVFSLETLASSLGATTTPYTGGTLSTNITPVNSAGVSDLMTYTLPANTLTTTGRGIRIKVWGSKSSSVNPATVALLIGAGTLVGKILPTTAIGVTLWEMEAVFLRTSLNNQRNVAKAFHSNGTSVSPTDGALVFDSLQHGTYTMTETISNVIKVSATTATGAEVTQNGMIIEAI